MQPDAATAAGSVEWTNTAENATGRPTISAATAVVCMIWDGITHEEEFLTVRGRQIYVLNNNSQWFT